MRAAHVSQSQQTNCLLSQSQQTNFLLSQSQHRNCFLKLPIIWHRLLVSWRCYRFSECLPSTQKSGNFGWAVNGKGILFCPTEKVPNVFRGNPKFPTGISKWKTMFHLLFSTSSRSCADSQTRSRLSVNYSELHKWYMPILNGISRSGGFAYHLHKP